jgi:transcriptional regulator with XRE-family HTH domain
MSSIMAKLKIVCEKQGLKNEDMASLLGKSDGQISSYFSGRYQISWGNFLVILKSLTLSKEEEEMFILGFALECNKKYDKDILEWSHNFGMKKLRDRILEKIKRNDPTNKTPALYTELINRNANSISGETFYKNIDAIKSSGYIKKEALILSKICTLYGYLDLKEYKMVTRFAGEVLDILDLAKSNYLEKSYRIRVLEVLAIALFKRGHEEKSVEIASEILKYKDEFPLPAVSMYSMLAELHVFKDYKKCLAYMNNAFLLFNVLPNNEFKLRKEMLKSTHDFIKITNDDFSNLFLNDSAEYAYYLAKVGRKNEALDILSNLEEKGLSPFQLYYKGIATGNTRFIELSERHFIEQGDIFYSYLPKRHMSIKIFLEE